MGIPFGSGGRTARDTLRSQYVESSTVGWVSSMDHKTADATPRTRALLSRVVMLIAVAVIALLPASATAQSGAEFPGLESGQRVYDQTQTSLTSTQIADLQQRLDELVSAGADAIVYVRELNVTPEQTLDQVEALQQSWVRRTGADQDNAVAVLINRNPDDPNDARAGVFVGRTFNDGNVDEGEQIAIVDEALIPPLRDGDVHGSLVAGVDRLTSSIRNGPPQSAFEEWSTIAANSWLPWVAIVVALAGLATAVALFGRRQTTDRPKRHSTTMRPRDLFPALAAALTLGGPQASAVPATLLDLAGRDALIIEPEKEGRFLRTATVQVRLVDAQSIRGEIESVVWQELQQRATGDLISSKALQKLAASPKPILDAVRDRLLAEDWLDPGARGARGALVLIGTLAAVLSFFTLVVAGVNGDWWPLSVGTATLALLAVTSFVFAAMYSPLSRRGQEAAIPWKAYRDGLKQAVKDDAVNVDLDAALPDIVAMNLGSSVGDRVEAASSSGQALRAFSTTSGAGLDNSAAVFPWWAAFNSSVSSSSGYGGGTVSGGGAGGGGGASGST